MRARVTGFFVKSILIVLFGIIALYFLAAYTYKNDFSYGTRINGIDCVGMTVPEVTSRLLEGYEVKDIEVSFPNDTNVTLKAGDIGVSVNYEAELSQIRYSQDPFLWGLSLFKGRTEETVAPVVTFDRDKLKSVVNSMSFVKEHDPERVQIISIALLDGEYVLIDTTGYSVNADYVFEHIYNCLCKGQTEIQIPDTFLTEHEYTETELETLYLWEDISRFTAPGLVYDMGDEKISFDSKYLCSLMEKENGLPVRDEFGRFKVDEEKIIAIADEICDKYDTFEKPRTFRSVNDEVKTLERCYYGTLLDKEAEEQYLLNAIKTGIKEEHIPKYIKEAYHRGLNDIGPNRIEIDLTRQKLYFIKDGVVDIESDVVTGNPRTLHATNEMLTTVQKMTRDTYLKGEGYRSFVNYWIAVYENKIGIHDASWQTAFGGDRYLTNGSKGCINVPKDVAEDLFSKVEVGMPVLIYK